MKKVEFLQFRVGAAYLLALLFFAITWFFASPIHLTLYLNEGTTAVPLVSSNGETLSPFEAIKPDARCVRITNIENRLVYLALPVINGTRVEPEVFEVLPGGDWIPWAHGRDRLQSVKAGSALRLCGIPKPLELAFPTATWAGAVEIHDGAHTRKVDLKSNTEGWKSIPLNVGPSVLATSISTPLEKADIRVSGAPSVKKIVVSLYSAPILIIEPPRNVKEFSFVIGVADILREHVSAIRTFLLLLGYCLCLAALWILIGTGLAGWKWDSDHPLESMVASAACGISLYAMAFGAVCMFLPAKAFVIPLTVVVATAAALRLWMAHNSGKATALPLQSDSLLKADELREVPLILFLSLFGAWLSMWPYLYSYEIGLGQLQTDVYDYLTIAQGFANVSVKEYASDFGFGLRSADSVLVATVLSLFGISARTSYAVLIVMAFLAAPLAAYFIASRMCMNFRIRMLCGAAVALSSSLSGLYVEGYFTRYAFTTLTLLLLFVLAASLERVAESKGRKQWQVLLPVAAVSSFGASLVPYFHVVPFALLGLGIFITGQRGKALLAGGLVLLALTLAIGNLNLQFLLHPEVPSRYVVGLNAIARNVLFPYIDTLLYPSVMLGLIPFHLLPGEMESLVFGVPTVDLVFHGLNRWVAAITWHSWAVVALLIVLFLPTLLWLIRSKRINFWQKSANSDREVLATIRVGARVVFSRESQLLAALLMLTLVGYLILFFALWLLGEKQLYGRATLGWTFFAMAPVFICANMLLLNLQFSENRGSLFSIAAAYFLALLVAFNVVARLADQARWVAHPLSNFGSARHTAITPDLVEAKRILSKLAKEEGSVGSLEIHSGGLALRGTDKDRVLINQLALLAADIGFRCINCNRGGGAKAVIWTGPACRGEAEAEVILAIASTPVDCQNRGYVEAYRGAFLSIFASKNALKDSRTGITPSVSEQ